MQGNRHHFRDGLNDPESLGILTSLKLLRDPLLHFVLAGAILFAGYELLNRGEPNASVTDPVHIGEVTMRMQERAYTSPIRYTPPK